MKILFLVNMEDLGFEEPLGVLYLSALCKYQGHDVCVSENRFSSVERMIKNTKPDLLAVSIITPSFPHLFDTIQAVKKKYDIPVLVGGPHATFFPEIINKAEIDYLIAGEGELALAEFLARISSGRSVDGLRNVAVKNSEKAVLKNGLRPLVQNLDDIRFPDRELFKDYPQFYGADVRSVMASRGCIYMCSYCYNHKYQEIYKGLGERFRVRSVDNVVEECVELKSRYRTRMIHFFDDIFPFKEEWIEEFADKYTKKVALPFFTNTSFSLCSEHYVKNLSRAGCKTLFVGVETGNERLREQVLLRKMSNAMMIQRSELLHKYDIKIYTQNLLGIPFGSLDIDIETLRLNISLKADFAMAYLCQPYPKTGIEKMAKEAHLVDENFVLSRSFYYSTPLKIADKKYVERLRIIFPLAVNFPFLSRGVRLLLKIPPLPLQILNNLLHGYKIVTVVLRYRMSPAVFIKNIKLFFLRRTNALFHADITVR